MSEVSQGRKETVIEEWGLDKWVVLPSLQLCVGSGQGLAARPALVSPLTQALTLPKVRGSCV